MEFKTLKAKARTMGTKGQLKDLRKNGEIPAVFYAPGKESVHFSVAAVDLREVWGPGKRNTLLKIEIDNGTTLSAVVYETQKDVITGAITHMDFKEVAEGVTAKVRIPVKLVGTPVGVKTQGGKFFQPTRFIRVEAATNALPENIEIDISEAQAGNTVYVRDIDLNGAKLVSSDRAVLFTISKARGTARA
jgi:large subunit ribosomal protein L25